MEKMKRIVSNLLLHNHPSGKITLFPEEIKGLLICVRDRGLD
jgi:hypothetical protein